MKFVVDETLPAALARWLLEQGYDAEHTSDLGLNATPDIDIVAHARQVGAVVVRKDKDHLVPGRGRDGPSVVSVRVGNMSTRDVLAVCSRVWPRVVEALTAGERIVAVRDAAAP